jgi:hypothetical protein
MRVALLGFVVLAVPVTALPTALAQIRASTIG